MTVYHVKPAKWKYKLKSPDYPSACMRPVCVTSMLHTAAWFYFHPVTGTLAPSVVHAYGGRGDHAILTGELCDKDKVIPQSLSATFSG